MKLVELHIANKQKDFSSHSFFEQVKGGVDFPQNLSFAPDLTFWVMAFQDILRLNARMTRDADLRRIVRHHLAEDAGHDRWFLDDLALLNVAAPDVQWLFSKKHVPTRDAAYALVSEVFRASNDVLRLVLVMTLESAGHVFFERVATMVRATADSYGLKYFSFAHLEVEKNHEVFERKMAEKISSLQLTPALRADAEDLVDRCYDAFTSMFDALGATDRRTITPVAAAASKARATSLRTQR
jgi:hypothetical protein